MVGIGVSMASEINILGLMIDRKLTFNAYVAHVCKKALGLHKQLAKAAKVSWGSWFRGRTNDLHSGSGAYNPVRSKRLGSH